MRVILVISILLGGLLGAWDQARAALDFDVETPQEIRTQFLADLEQAGAIQLSRTSPLHQQIFGNGNGGDSYKSFFSTRVMRVGPHHCGGGDSIIACVIMYIDSRKILLTPNYAKFNIPLIGRLLVIFHETRHTEKKVGNWLHVTCPVPFLDDEGKEVKGIWSGRPIAGLPGCDSTALGGYGLTSIMLKNIEKSCANCTEKMKLDANIFSTDDAKRVITPEAKVALKEDLNFFSK